jgi:hypothetical protein
MSWISYNNDVEDGSFVHGDDYLDSLLKTFIHEPDHATIATLMVEFKDGSFLRVERAGDK